jgi:hypothetical protein
MEKKITLDKDQLIKGDDVNYNELMSDVEVYINGYRVKTSYNLGLTREQLLRKLRGKKFNELTETVVVIKVKKEALSKEIILEGYFRNIFTGEWQ